MGYPQEFIDKVLDASNLVDIISQYTQLKGSGRGHMGRCPFPDHQEKTASFSVSEIKQVYHCFGCKKSGNVISFLRDYNGMNFPDALEYLADRARIPIPEIKNDLNNQASSNAYSSQQDLKKKILRANKLSSDFFRETLKRSASDQPIKIYINRRKLNIETLQEFQIGYAPPDWEALTHYLQKNNLDLDLAEKARLVKKRNEGQGYFDLFRDRLMFPIMSPAGEVLAFGGRILEQGEPKYLNSPESEVFHKGKVLYGLAQTARFIRAEDSVLVVEGYMDLVSLYQSGFKNVVATMGTALTLDHAKLLKRLTTNVIVLFDSDEAGQMAAERSLPILLSQGLFPRSLTFTEAKDPDEFLVKFGAAALTERLQKSPDLFKSVLRTWMADYKGEPSDKVKLVDKIKPIFETMSDQRLKSLYADELCQILGVSKEWLRVSLKSQQNSKMSPQNLGFSQPNSENTQAVRSEKTDTNESTLVQIKIADAPQVELMLLQSVLKSRASFSLISEMGENNLIEPLNSQAMISEMNFQEDDFKDEKGLLPRALDFKQLLSQIRHLGVKEILENAELAYRQEGSKFDRLISLLVDKIDKPELLFQNSNLFSKSQSASTLDVTDSEEMKSEIEIKNSSSENETESELFTQRKLVSDLVFRIQQEFFKEKAKQVAQNLKQNMKLNLGFNQVSSIGSSSQVNEEQLRKFSELQKSRLALKKK